MKPRVLIRAFAAALLTGCGAITVNAGPAIDTEAEWLATGDLNNDGHPDVVVVDRASGIVRAGYRDGNGKLVWSGGRATGITDPSHIALRELFTPGQATLALTRPDLNQVVLLDLDDSVDPLSGQAVPVVPHAGPGFVAILPAMGTAPNDLLVASELNNQPAPGRLALLQQSGGSALSPGSSNLLGSIWSYGIPFLTEAGGREDVLVLQPGDGTVLHYRVEGGALAPVGVLNISGYKPTTRFLYGFFNASSTGQALVYTRNKDRVQIYALNAGGPGTYSFGPGQDLLLPAPVYNVIALPFNNQLLVIYASGIAEVFDFNGSTLSNRQALPPPAGESWTAVLPGSGDLHLLSSTAGPGGRSEHMQRFKFSGTWLPSDGPEDLPPVDTANAAGAANVLLYDGEPFVDAGIQRRGAWRVPDWSIDHQPIAGATLELRSQEDQGSEDGLGPTHTQTLDNLPLGGGFVLLNQYRADISVSPQLPAAGAVPGGMAIDPAPGLYADAIQVEITSNGALNRIRYRINGGNWIFYSAPIWLYENSRVEYYAYDAGLTLATPIEQAVYTFTRAAGAQDQDGDGVPDFVEIANGLDPAGGPDSDDDGLTDLDELLGGTEPDDPDSDNDGFSDREERAAGTDPNSNASQPTPAQVLAGNPAQVEKLAAVDLYVTPRPIRTNFTTRVFAETGTVVRVFALDGPALGVGATANLGLPGLVGPTALLRDLPTATRPRFVAALTEINFDLAVATPNPRQGREMTRIEQLPASAPLVIPYVDGGGSQAAEAAAWVNAASTAWSTVAAPELRLSMDVWHTTAALLFECFVGEQLHDRNVTTNEISLLAGRNEAPSFHHPTLAELTGIEGPSTNATPAYRLIDVHTNILDRVFNGGHSDLHALRDLTEKVYQLAAGEGSLDPGGFPLPIDALRTFLKTGMLPLAYTNHVGAILMVRAHRGANAILDALPARPVLTVDLRVPSTVNLDCTSLEGVSDGQTYHLVDDLGRPVPLAELLPLPAGAELTVTGYRNGIGGCTGSDVEIEVRSLELTALLLPTGQDLDANLMQDDWELLAFGVTGGLPGGDRDRDGYTDLHEFLEGTDPTNANDYPAGDPEPALATPVIQIERSGPTELTVSWYWPTAYTAPFDFVLYAAAEPGEEMVITPAVISPAPGDQLQATISLDGLGNHGVYRVGIRLR